MIEEFEANDGGIACFVPPQQGQMAGLTKELAIDALDGLKLLDAYLHSVGDLDLMALAVRGEAVLAALIEQQWPEPKAVVTDADIPF